MSGLIALAPPFVGAPDVLQSLIIGPVEAGITPVALSTKLGRATGTWPALVSADGGAVTSPAVYSLFV